MHESKSFNVSSIESLSSHIFRATHAINTYKGEDIENTRGELGHKNISTTKNSYIKAEKRGLNLYEEMNSTPLDYFLYSNENKIKNKKVDKSSKEIEKKADDLDIKLIFDNKNKNIKANNEENEEDIFIDDDFEIGNSIAFFSGHFYDDADILAYKQKIKNNDDYNQISENFYNDDESTIFLKKKNNKDKNGTKEISLTDNLLLNLDNNKGKSIQNKNSLNKLLKIIDFKDSLIIKETEKDMITTNKIKNKKELYILSENERIILSKTIENNKNGLFYNIRAENQDGKIFLKSTNNIKKKTLITLVGGTIYYLKRHNKMKITKDRNNKPEIAFLYFKTAKKAYDRIIVVPKTSPINFMYDESSNKTPNLKLLKAVDSNNLIKLLVISSRDIKEGETLLLDNNNILNN